jgi:hypothetical protein
MDKKLVIALVNSLIEKRINAIDHDVFRGSRGPRGAKGLKGDPGKDFVFDENKNQINDLIQDHIESIKDYLALDFDSLTEEQKQSLKPTFSDLTQDELLQLRGPRGQRGKPGKSIDWNEVKDEVYQNLVTLFSTEKDELKLKFSDLTECEKENLRLKFEHLTDEQKQELKGEKGERGARGSRGPKGEKRRKWFTGTTRLKGRSGTTRRKRCKGLSWSTWQKRRSG